MKDKKDNKMDEIRKSLPKGVTASGIFTDNDLRVLHVLTRMQETDFSEFYKEHGYFHVSNEKLREETGIADNHSLGRSLDRLIEYGLISRTRGKRGKQSEYVYHAEAANNFTMEKQDKKSKKKGAHSEKLTHPETQAVTVQSEKGAHSDEKSAPILKINDLHEIIAKAVEKGCTPLTKQIEAGCATLVKKIEELNANLLRMSMGAHSETKGALLEADGALFEGEKRGRTIGDEPNSLKMRMGAHSDSEKEPNSLKMSMGAHSETKGAHSEKCTTDIDIYNNILYHDDHVSRGQDPGEESLIESTHIVTSPVLKEIERKKNKKNNSPRVSERKGAAATGVVVVSDENEVSGKAGDTPAGPRDANGAFLNKKPADAQQPSGGNHPDPSSGVSRSVEPPQASGIGDSANPHCGEQEEKTPPPPAPAENANKRHLSAPESQNELHLKPEGENPSGDKPEPQGASCGEEHSSMEVAWADEAMKEAEARGDAQAYLNAIHARHDACRKEDGAKASRGKVSDSEIERLYREAFVERTLDANTLPTGILNALGRYADSLERAKPKPYPDTEPLGNVIYEPASTREARIERKATTRYA